MAGLTGWLAGALATAMAVRAVGLGDMARTGAGADLLIFTNIAAFESKPGGEAGTIVLTSPVAVARSPWNELIVSWNLTSNAIARIEAAPVGDASESRYFLLGDWSAHARRSSPPSQAGPDGDVATDTLRLTKRWGAARVRLTVFGRAADVRLVGFAFADTLRPPPPRPAHTNAWGRTIDAPRRSQAIYPEGVNRWCSPTATSMLLGFWAGQTGRPELDHSPPEIAAGVDDPGWGGAGNWPFNTAYAGMQPGLRACVARFPDLAELEKWIEAGYPVAASVSYTMMKGSAAPEAGDGHLVVVCGFDVAGNVVINDPGVALERVRRTVPRRDFDRGWSRSARTVYLVWPEDRRPPLPGS